MDLKNLYTVRFRTANGDVGPFTFESYVSIYTLKMKLFEEWPQDGPVAPDRPNNVEEIRLICSGRFLENPSQLKESIVKVVGEPSSDLLVTMHVIVRPPTPPKTTKQIINHNTSACSCCAIT